MELVKLEKKPTKLEQAEEVINFLNEKIGGRFRASKTNLTHIYARMDEGFTVEEMCAVIAMKHKDHLQGKFDRLYLRPITLFNCEKFDQYYGLLGPKEEPVDDSCPYIENGKRCGKPGVTSNDTKGRGTWYCCYEHSVG